MEATKIPRETALLNIDQVITLTFARDTSYASIDYFDTDLYAVVV